MDFKKWIYYNNGIDVTRIAKKKLRFSDIRGIFNIYEAIINLKSDEYIKIPVNQQLFPLFRLWEMTSRDFKKRGNQFNLSLGIKKDMIENRVTPQKSICDIINTTYKDLNFIEEKRYEDLQRNQEIYNQICRRGFKWNRRCSMLHTIMPQRELSRGWRLASLIINEDMNLRYSNPGNIFFMEIPSTTKDPNLVKYIIKLYNFVTSYPDCYGDWQMLDGQISSLGDEFEKALFGIDMYSPASLRYKIQEFRLNFQLIAGAILRQHYNDNRMHQGKFKNLKRVLEQEIKPVVLNIPIPPTKERIRLDWILDNNVLLEYETKNKEIALKKLNVGERELIFSIDTYLKFLDRRSPFVIDEELNSLDEIVQRHKEIICF